MRCGKTIAGALRRLGTDAEMWRALTNLKEALAGVLGNPEERCERCGGVERDVARDIPDLAERLDAVLHLLHQRLQPASEMQARSMQPATSEAWARSRPDIAPGARQPKSRDGLQGGDR